MTNVPSPIDTDDASADTFNPFGSITADDMITYAGKVIAVDLEKGGIIAAAKSSDLLHVLMENFDGQYGRLCLPSLAMLQGEDDTEPETAFDETRESHSSVMTTRGNNGEEED